MISHIPKILIVLSGGLTKKHQLPFFVKSRLDHAYKLFHLGSVSTIIVSGKWSYQYETDLPVTEAEVMKQYLIKLGIPERKIKKEETSQDLLSSAYYLKKNILLPKNITEATIICTDFEELRVKYVFHKVFGDEISFHIIIEPSSLKSEVMWQFFAHERAMLLDTKTSLRNMKTGNHAYLEKRFYSSPLYTEKKVGIIRMNVYGRKIDKRKTAKAHYSLARILAKRKELYAQYRIKNPVKKTLTADFWSGRFLNFLGKDDDKNLYSLKFVLYLKDKKTFANEVKISQHLIKHGIDYIPTIVASGYDKAPPWYLYRIVKGRMSGMFSYTYSFSDSFYHNPNIPRLFASHLATLRSVSKENLHIPTWTSAVYKRRLGEIYKKLKRHPQAFADPIVEKAYTIFRKKSNALNTAALYLTHADLHPANIIYSKSKLYFIDFEHVSYTNIAFDFCFGYVFSWNNQAFQEKLMRTFQKTLTKKEREEFDHLFPLVYTYFLLWLYLFTFLWEYKSGKENAQITRVILIAELKKQVSYLEGVTS